MKKMVKWIAASGAAASMVAALPAVAAVDASAASMLALGNSCMGCHAIDRKMVGPAFQDIAKKYHGDATAEDKLVTKVIKGGAGVWGMVPMPSHPGLSQADAHTIVQWVLEGAPNK
jgi:cytochrome c